MAPYHVYRPFSNADLLARARTLTVDATGTSRYVADLFIRLCSPGELHGPIRWAMQAPLSLDLSGESPILDVDMCCIAGGSDIGGTL